MGSQDWNSQEKPQGFYAAGAERQQAILKAAKRARQQASAREIASPSASSLGGFGSPQSVAEQSLLTSGPTHSQPAAQPHPTEQPEPRRISPEGSAGPTAHYEGAFQQQAGGAQSPMEAEERVQDSVLEEASSRPAEARSTMRGDAAAMELGPSGRSGSEEVGTHLGGGALLLVLAGSSHHSFHDVLALFSTYFKGILKKVGTRPGQCISCYLWSDHGTRHG